MKAYKSKNSIAIGALLVVIGLMGALESRATVAVGLDDDFSGASEQWYGNFTTQTLTNDLLRFDMDNASDAALGSTYHSLSPLLTLDVGETLSMSFDIARDAAISNGYLSVYLNTGNSASGYGYGFQAGFGASATPVIGFDFNGKSTPTDFELVFGSGAAGSSAAVALTGNGFTTYEWTIKRVETNTLTFALLQNSNTLVSTTETFDGVENPVSRLLTDFGRMYIDWTDTGASGGDSFYLDNVKVQITSDTSINETTFATSGSGGWFSQSGRGDLTGGDYLNVQLADPSFGSVYNSASFDQLLDVGYTLEYSFDIARDPAILGGEVRAYLRNSDNDAAYMFEVALGSTADASIGYVGTGFPNNAPEAGTTYAAGLSSSAVGTDIVSDFDTYKLTIQRVDTDSLTFRLFQNDGMLVSTAETFDGVGRPATELLTAFNRIYIGWTDTAATTNDSFQIDNVLLRVVPTPASPDLTYDLWADGNNLLGPARNLDADIENGGIGDGMDNLLEYALGGDPNVDDAATILPVYQLLDAGGTNWIEYVYNRRTNYVALGLVYEVQSAPDLVFTAFTNGSPVELVGSGAPDGNGFEPVTNRVDTGSGNAYFLRLQVEQN